MQHNNYHYLYKKLYYQSIALSKNFLFCSCDNQNPINPDAARDLSDARFGILDGFTSPKSKG
jgi:hypothetical protein